jgi:hypothetical protein
MEQDSKPRIILVRPETDPDACELSNWAEMFVRTQPNCLIVNLQGRSASRRRLASAVTFQCSACFFFCHGTQSALIGNDESILDDANANLTHGLIIIAIACHSAKALGVSVIKEGAVGFWGFNDLLIWAPEFTEEFGHAAVSGALALVRGLTLAESALAMRQAYKDLVEKLRSSRSSNSMIASMAAFWNQGHIEARGNLTAVLASGRQSVGAS